MSVGSDKNLWMQVRFVERSNYKQVPQQLESPLLSSGFFLNEILFKIGIKTN